MTEGRRELIKLLQRLKTREVAARLNVSKAYVSLWVCGRRVPPAHLAFALEAEFGIQAAKWSTPVVRLSA